MRVLGLVDIRRCAIKEESAVNASGTIRNKFFDNRYVVLYLPVGFWPRPFLSPAGGKFVDIERYSVAVVYNFDILPGPLAIALRMGPSIY